MKQTFHLLAGSILLCAGAATAQTKDSTDTKKLDEVIIRTHQQSTKINMLDPIRSDKIGSAELLRAACCNLSESFETTPSVDVAYTDAVTGYKQIQMLGLTGPYTLITRENIPDTRGLAAITGLTYTPGTWIEGMQLSKGTGSVVNGYESVAGQINVEWRKPFEEKAEKWNLNLYQNTQGRTEANLIRNVRINKSLSTNVFLHAKSQWLKTDQNHDGFLDQPLDKQIIAANRWFWFGPRGWEIQAGAKAIAVENIGGQWDFEKGEPQATGHPWGFQLNTHRYEGWAKIGHVFHHPAKSMGLQLSYIHHQQDAEYGARRYEGLQNSVYANLIFQSFFGTTNHVIKTGASLLLDHYDESFAGARYSRSENVPGVFAEYAWNTKKFNLVAGLRGDYNSLFGGFVTPRLHLRYAPLDRTVLRASVGRAQRTANIFAENMGFMASNRNFVIGSGDLQQKAYGLDPEVAWNFGLSLTQKFRLDYRDGALSVDYYYTNFQNQIVVDFERPEAVKFYNLSGRSYASSLQFQADYELVHKLDLRLAYRWYHVSTTYDGVLKERPLVAAHRAFANIGYATRNKWKLDYTVQWMGSKRIPATYHSLGNESTSPSFVVMNLQVTKSFDERFDWYLGAENLTNYMMHEPVIGAQHPYETGFDASLIWGPVMGRNVYTGIRWKLF